MKKLVLMALVIFTLSACQSKDSYVKDFGKFVDEVELSAANYDEKDWEKADKKLERFSTDLYKKYEEELSSDEKGEIIKLQATYAGVRLKHGLKDAGKKMNKFFEGLKEGTK